MATKTPYFSYIVPHRFTLTAPHQKAP